MKYLKYILSSVILFAMVSCDAFSDPDLPIPLDETMDNTGAFLRVLDVESAGFDILNLNTAAFVFTAEYWDDEDQGLLDNVEFYSNYSAGEGQRPAVGRTLIKTYDAANFGTNEATGWPSQTFEISIVEINNVLGIDGPNENLLGDRYQVDWVLNLTDGRSFSSNEMSPAITGGFFSSPNQRNVDVVAAIPAEDFVGEYTFQQMNNATFGPMYEAATFVQDLEVDANNTLNGRNFMAGYLGAVVNVTPHANRIVVALANDTDNNSVTLGTSYNSGLACAGGPALLMGPENEQTSQFDLNDDSVFLMTIYENTEGGCGASPRDVRFTVTKGLLE